MSSLEEVIRRRQEELKAQQRAARRSRRLDLWEGFVARLKRCFLPRRKTIGVGDWVEFPVGSRLPHLVVDIDPPDVCTPYPCLMIAWKSGNRPMEAVVELKQVRKL
jgi:hypothetical protein